MMLEFLEALGLSSNINSRLKNIFKFFVYFIIFVGSLDCVFLAQLFSTNSPELSKSL